MAKNTPTTDLISLAEAAELSGYHQDYLGSLCRKGKLQGQKIGRTWVVSKQALDKFMGKVEVPKAEPAVVAPVIVAEPDFVTPAVDHKIEQLQSKIALRKFDGMLHMLEHRVGSLARKLEQRVIAVAPATHVALAKIQHPVRLVVAVSAAVVAFVVMATAMLVPRPHTDEAVLVVHQNQSNNFGEVAGIDSGNEETTASQRGHGQVLGTVTSLSSLSALDIPGLDQLILQNIAQVISAGWWPQAQPPTTPTSTAQNSQPSFGSVPSYAPITYIQPTSSFPSGVSLLSATDLSSERFTTGAATITGTATISNLVVENNTELNGDLSVDGNADFGFTLGSVVFQGSNGLTEDNTHFVWDDTQNALGIGTNTVSSSAVLQLDATDKGFLAPRMTTVQRDAITSPVEGLTVYNTSSGKYNYYTGGIWTEVASGVISSALSGLTAATGDASINSGANNIVWNWQLTGGESAFTFGENVASTGGTNNQYILQAGVLAASTATPMYVKNLGVANSFQVDDAVADTTPFVIDASGNVGIGLAGPTSILHVQQAADSSVTATPVVFDINSVGAAGELTASSGTQTFARIAPTVNQSSTAGYTALLVNATETAIGSGSQKLLELQNGGTSKFYVTSGAAPTLNLAGQYGASAFTVYDGQLSLYNTGYQSTPFQITPSHGNSYTRFTNAYGSFVFSGALSTENASQNIVSAGKLGVGISPTSALHVVPAARTSGSLPYVVLRTPADTTLTASTESIGIQFGGDASAATVTRQFATGALTTQRENVFVAPTYGFAGASTLTTAATVAITGAPVAGTNATITNPYALLVQDGAVRFGALTNPPSPTTTQFTLGGTGNINFALQSNSDNDRYINFNASNASVRARLGFNVASNAFEIIGDNVSLGQSLVLSSNGEGIRIVSGGLVGVNKTSSIGAQIHTVSGSSSRIAGIFEGAASNSAAVLVAKSGSSGTGNLLELQNSSGTVMSYFNSAGHLYLPVGSTGGGNGIYFANGASLRASIGYDEVYGGVTIGSNSAALFRVDSSTASVRGDMQLAWFTGAIPTSGIDLGLARAAASTLRVTDGSTGAGKLVVGSSSASTSAAQLYTLPTSASVIAGQFEGAASNSAAILVAKSGSSGTGNLFEAQNSSGTSLFTVSGTATSLARVNHTDGNRRVTLGVLGGSSEYGTIWLGNTASQDFAKAVLYGNGSTETVLNGAGSAGKIQFRIDNTNTPSAMTITNESSVGYRVGIFRDSPSAQLHVVSRTASDVGFRVDSAASPATDILQVTVNGTANSGFIVTSTGAPSAPGAGTASERFGSGSTAAGNNGVAIGNSASAGGINSVAIGKSVSASATSMIRIGANGTLSAGGTSYIWLGDGGTSSGTGNVLLGTGLSAGSGGNYVDSSVIIGNSASAAGAGSAWLVNLIGAGVTATASNQFVSGSSTAAMTNVYFGEGVTDATPLAYTINGTGGSGSNIAGAALQLAGGIGTGTGVGGDIIFKYAAAGSSGSSANSLATACTISGTNGSLSCPGAGSNSQRFGASSLAGGTRGLALGESANSGTGSENIAIGWSATTSSGNSNIAIGRSSSATNRSIAIGYTASSSGALSVVLGDAASATGDNTLAVGYQATAAYSNSIALGYNATTTASNQIVIGGLLSPINDMYLGTGVASVYANNISIQPTGASGTNVAGNNFTLAAGKATGNAAGGDILFQTSDAGSSGATAQSLTTKMIVKASGNVGIGTASPDTTLDVASANTTTASRGNLLVRSSGSGQAADAGGHIGFGGLYITGDASSYTGFAGIAGRKENNTSANTAGYLTLETRPAGGSNTERLRIDSTGNVGIGTSSPTTKLQVTSTQFGIYSFGGGVRADNVELGAYRYATSNNSINVFGGNLILQDGDTSYTGNVGIGVTSPTAKLHVVPNARTSGSDSYFKVQTPADTTLTASTESIGIQFGGDSSAATVTRQWATGALTTQRENLFVGPTYSFVGASTITTAATLAVTAPVAGTNATITNKAAIYLPLEADALLFGSTFGIGARSTIKKETGGGALEIVNYWSNTAQASLILYNSGMQIASDVTRIMNAARTYEVMTFNGTGNAAINTGGAINTAIQLEVLSNSATRVVGQFQGAASNSAAVLVAKSGSSGTGNLFEAQNSSGTALASVTSAGYVRATSGTTSIPGIGYSSAGINQTNGGYGLGVVTATGFGLNLGYNEVSFKDTGGVLAWGQVSVFGTSETMRLSNPSSGVLQIGVTSASPSNYTIQGAAGTGTNIAGGALQLAGGIGTGTGVGGDIIFNTLQLVALVLLLILWLPLVLCLERMEAFLVRELVLLVKDLVAVPAFRVQVMQSH